MAKNQFRLFKSLYNYSLCLYVSVVPNCVISKIRSTEFASRFLNKKQIYLLKGLLTAVIRYFSPFPSQSIYMCRSSPPRLKLIAKFPNQDQRICFHIFFLKCFFGDWYFIKITKMWKLYVLREFLNHILSKFPNQDQRICFLIFLLKCFFGIKVFWNNQDYRICLHIFFLENYFLV